MPAGRGTVSLGPGERIAREAEVAHQGPEVLAVAERPEVGVPAHARCVAEPGGHGPSQRVHRPIGRGPPLRERPVRPGMHSARQRARS